VGAFTPGATSKVIATVLPRTWPLSGKSAWPADVVPAGTGAWLGGMIQAS
jgi:hypothetical protein